MQTRNFGKNKKGEPATLYSFENPNGMIMEVTDLGATLHALRVPNPEGKLYDVVLGYDDAQGYEGGSGTFMGATVGRNANRIGKGRFTLNGQSYQLDINNGPNNLHSGLDYYCFRIWEVKAVEDNSITFSLHSPDGDQGYPGAVDIEVTYTLTEDNSVAIRYYAVPDQDTIINLTNHSYFNLAGDASGDILEQELWIDADYYTATDETQIPTGEIVAVDETPMDFRERKEIGRDIKVDYEALNIAKGYDHNMILNNNGRMQKVAELFSKESKITMEVYTDLCGIQIYTGNYLDHEPGKNGVIYQKNQGICFETQYYPDAINHEQFPDPIFRKGETYRTDTIYKFV